MLGHKLSKTIFNQGRFSPPKRPLDCSVFARQVHRAQDREYIGPLAVISQTIVGLRPAVRSQLSSSGNVAIVVHLLDDGRKPGQVHHRQPFPRRLLNAPLVEPHSPDGQRRHVSMRTVREDKKIYPL